MSPLVCRDKKKDRNGKLIYFSGVSPSTVSCYFSW
jgi:hypothetical protein